MKVSRKGDKSLIYKKGAHNFYIYYYYYNYKRLECYLIRKGNKLKSKMVMSNLRYLVKKEVNLSYFIIFFFCFFNLYPVIGLRNIRLGGAKKEIPITLSFKRRVFLVRKKLLKGIIIKNHINIKSLVDIIVKTFYMKGNAVNELMEDYNTGVTNSYLLHLVK